AEILLRRMLKQIADGSQPFADHQQIVVSGLNIGAHLVPAERGGDGCSYACARRIGSGDGLALVMLEIVEVDEVAAIFLETLDREQLRMRPRQIFGDEEPDVANLIEGELLAQWHDDLNACRAGSLRNGLNAERPQELAC